MSVYRGESSKPKRRYPRTEKTYRSIFENAIEGFFQSTPEGKFLTVNPAMARIMGYGSPADLLANIQSIDHQFYVSPARRKEFKRLLEMQGFVQNFESEIFRRDGSKIWISANARTVRGGNGGRFFYEGFVAEITEHKRAEQSLQEGEQFLSSIFASIQDGISVLDQDFNIIRVNPTMERWFSHSFPLVGKKCYEAYRQQTKPCSTCPSLQVIQTGQAGYKLESKTGPNGEIIGWLDLYSFPLLDSVTGKPRGVIEYVRDISDRKQTEEAFRRSEGEARRLAHEMAVMAEIGKIISSTLNIEEVYEKFANEVRKLIQFDRLAINLADLEEGTVVNAYRSGVDVEGRRPGEIILLRGSIVEHILRTRKTLLVCPGDDEEELKRSYPTLASTFQAGLRSMMSVPLFSRDQVIGVLHFRSFRERAYSENDIQLAESIAGQIAGAIASARLFSGHRHVEMALQKSEQEARRLARENAAMAEIGRILCSTLKIEEVYERFAEAVQKLIPFERMAINIIHPEEKNFSIPYTTGREVKDRRQGEVIPLAGTAAEEIVRTRSSLRLLRDEMDKIVELFPGLKPVFAAGFHSVVMVPLVSQDQVIGILNLQRARPPIFSEDEVRLAEKVAAQIAGAVANAQLFAERERAERAHRESEEKYRLLVENANDAIFIIQDQVIRFSNIKTQEWFGYGAADLAAIPFEEHIHPLDREGVYGRMRVEEEKFPTNQSFRIRSRKDQEFWIELNSVPILWEGRPATLNFARNITEQKKLEAQFLQAQKMEAVGRLAGGVAHDFNNLLTVINSHSQLALMELKEWDPLREKFESIQEAGEKAANLTRQLLAFSRRQVVEMKVININEILLNLGKMLHRVIGEDIELKTLLHQGLGRVKADPGQIEQAILNLVLNARDAMPTGGKLTVETANVAVDKGYTMKSMDMKPGRYVMLSVSDTGVGMPPEVKERIFEPFFTTKEKGKGTGLGLSTVYGVVKQSGGEIWIYSELGKGTTVKIYLPEVDEPLEESKKKVHGKIPGGKETVLVVEDEDEVRALAVRILSKQGYKVVEAGHGGDALLMLEKVRDPIHLLLTDVVMPGISGPDFARRLKILYPEIKVLFMSGYTDNVILQAGILERGIAFLQKPFTVEELAGKVREVLDM